MAKRRVRDYYLGLDIGTNSVGWAVTDPQYNVLKFKGKSMWGVRLFDAAQTAAERRGFRTTRRRIDRRGWRLELLQELFQDEINKKDPEFFLRMKESALYPEDSRTGKPFALFCGKDLNDKSYYKQYPTIYHLRKALLTEDQKFDIRLLYLAIHHIMKHRGHFLFPGDFMNVTQFKFVFEQLQARLNDELGLMLECSDTQKLSEVLKDNHLGKNDKMKEACALLQFSGDKKQLQAIVGLICGVKKKLSDVFMDEELSEADVNIFSLVDKPYDELRPELEAVLADKCAVIDDIKGVHDWALLADMLDGGEWGNSTYLSVARVKQYDKHKQDLKKLKRIVRKYCPSEYKAFFSKAEKDNYCAYIGAGIETKNTKAVTKCKQEDFYKRVKALINQAGEKGCPVEITEGILKDIEAQTFLPLQVSKDNSVIPHQVHEMELEQILNKASQYYSFLEEKDTEGNQTADKIMQLFRFRIPYYVGPLNSYGKNSWIIRRAAGKIYPWNFEEKVDLDKSEEQFIQRMTKPCTYMIGASVLPKYSLLYSEFMVLNELNNVRVCGEKLPVDLKQRIFNDLFCKTRHVTLRMFCNQLKAEGFVPKNANGNNKIQPEDITGIDQDFKSSLVSYIEMHEIFGNELNKFTVQQMCERIIFLLSIHHDDKKRLQKQIREEYSNQQITDEQLEKVSRLLYKGWGKFSYEFLCELKGVDTETGEVFSIIEALRQTNDNLMQLLSSRYTFEKNRNEYNQDKRKQITSLTYDNVMGDVIASPAVKRSAWQAISITKELCKIMGRKPERIFIEMARGPEEKKRTDSRKKKLLKLYKSIKDESRDWKKELESKEEYEFRSIKLYLYYTQMGRCMYTGEAIRLEDLTNVNIYDRDHIYPQSLTKDDSLDNLVLVKRQENLKKSNGLVSETVQKKMKPFWTMLRDKGLISKEKFNRLIRTEPLTDEELAGFINRQLVEARQSTKIVAEKFGELYPKTEIVYVKAKNVSDFRQNTLKILKVRSVNDFHHAKDAYLNVVVGNVYYEKFTKNSLTWLKNNKGRKYSLNQMFNFDLTRKKGNDVIYIWKKGNDGSIVTVTKTIVRNDVLYTRQAICNVNGGLFNQNIVSCLNQPSLPIKKGMDIDKYGGYKGISPSSFALVEYTDKNGKRQRMIEAVPLYLNDAIAKDQNVLIEFYKENLGLKDPSIILMGIKKNALLKINGFLVHLRGTSGYAANQLSVQNAVELCVSKDVEAYVKKLENYMKRRDIIGNALKVTEWDGITDEYNLALYDLFIDKFKNSIFKSRPANQGSNLEKFRNKFINLVLENQCIVLMQILMLFACKPSMTADLSLVGGSKKAGNMALSKSLGNVESAILINQSVTGLFEQKTDLLMVKEAVTKKF